MIGNREVDSNFEAYSVLMRARWLHILKHWFFSMQETGISEGFTLYRTNSWNHRNETEYFPITSAGIVVITSVDKDPMMILVNEEASRWDIPSGRIEATDLSPKAAAIREFGEETGFDLTSRAEEVYALTYAVNRSGTKAGVQYYCVTALDLSEATLLHIDDEGRYFYTVTRGEEVLHLALEPMHVFMDGDSLLKMSHHPWAYRRTIAALEQKFSLAKVTGYVGE